MRFTSHNGSRDARRAAEEQELRVDRAPKRKKIPWKTRHRAGCPHRGRHIGCHPGFDFSSVDRGCRNRLIATDAGKSGVSATSVSCPSSLFCVAVDETGDALTYNGSSGTAPAPIYSAEGLASVSCPSASFCAAVDSRGNAPIYGEGGSSRLPPSSASPPAIVGSAQVGHDLNCSPNSWSGAAPTLAYERQRDGVAITGATASSYTVQTADEGHAGLQGHRVRRINVVIGRSRYRIAAGDRSVVRNRLNRPGRVLMHRTGRRGLRARFVGCAIRRRALLLKSAPRRRHRRPVRSSR